MCCVAGGLNKHVHKLKGIEKAKQYQKVFVKEALVIAAFPPVGIQTLQSRAAVVHAVKRGHAGA